MIRISKYYTKDAPHCFSFLVCSLIGLYFHLLDQFVSVSESLCRKFLIKMKIHRIYSRHFLYHWFSFVNFTSLNSKLIRTEPHHFHNPKIFGIRPIPFLHSLCMSPCESLLSIVQISFEWDKSHIFLLFVILLPWLRITTLRRINY